MKRFILLLLLACLPAVSFHAGAAPAARYPGQGEKDTGPEQEGSSFSYPSQTFSYAGLFESIVSLPALKRGMVSPGRFFVAAGDEPGLPGVVACRRCHSVLWTRFYLACIYPFHNFW